MFRNLKPAELKHDSPETPISEVGRNIMYLLECKLNHVESMDLIDSVMTGKSADERLQLLTKKLEQMQKACLISKEEEKTLSDEERKAKNKKAALIASISEQDKKTITGMIDTNFSKLSAAKSLDQEDAKPCISLRATFASS